MLNQVTIMGRLTRDPELRRTSSGVAVASFTVAVERDFGNDKGEKETDFFDCVAWRQTGEFVAKYFTKGRMIVVSGRLQQRRWSDKDGNKRSNVEIVADNIYFGDSKRESDGKGKNYNSPQGGGSANYGGNTDYDGNGYNGGYAPNYGGAPAGGAMPPVGNFAPSADYSGPTNYGAPSGGFTPPAGEYASPAQSGGFAPTAAGQYNGQNYATGVTYGAMPVLEDE